MKPRELGWWAVCGLDRSHFQASDFELTQERRVADVFDSNTVDSGTDHDGLAGRDPVHSRSFIPAHPGNRKTLIDRMASSDPNTANLNGSRGNGSVGASRDQASEFDSVNL